MFWLSRVVGIHKKTVGVVVATGRVESIGVNVDKILPDLQRMRVLNPIPTVHRTTNPRPFIDKIPHLENPHKSLKPTADPHAFLGTIRNATTNLTNVNPDDILFKPVIKNHLVLKNTVWKCLFQVFEGKELWEGYQDHWKADLSDSWWGKHHLCYILDQSLASLV